MADDGLGSPTARILVVCTANLARSPLTQALLRHHLPIPGLLVTSAGTQAHAGLPAAEGALELAAARGLDLSTHRSQPVTHDLVRDSDLVLTMSERQRDRCASKVARGGPRTFTLREFIRLLDAAELAGSPATSIDRVRWIRDRAHRARPRAVRPKDPEDIADPIGRPPKAWRALGEQIDAAVARITAAIEDGR